MCSDVNDAFNFFDAKDYFDWHRAVTKQLNESNSHDYKYLILTCEKDQRCGGISDRLQPLPFYVAAAARFGRVFLIRWEKPKQLEEFLLPNDINWTVPSWLHDTVGPRNIKRAQKGKDLTRHLQLSSKTIVQGRLQDSLGGTDRYQQIVEADNCTSYIPNRRPDNQTAVMDQKLFRQQMGSIAYRNIYHDLFRSMFAPVPPLAQLLYQRLQSNNLIPGMYTAAHFRAYYDTNDEKTVSGSWIQKWAINAVNCASVLQPGSPVYFSSDSKAAVEAVQEYATTHNRSIVTFADEDDPLHIEKTTDWERRPASDFYATFADLLSLGSGRCLAYGSGGYGRYASLLSHRSSCSLQHGPEHAYCRWRGGHSSGTASDYFTMSTNAPNHLEVSVADQKKPRSVSSQETPRAFSRLDQAIPYGQHSVTVLMEGPLAKSQSTIVTAYYQVPSKHTPDRYITWMKNMLSLQDPMVIFTQPNFVDAISEFRSHATNRTVIVGLDLEHLPIVSLGPHSFWRNQLDQDPEHEIHRSYELFWIWLSKTWFVTQAIQMNFFDSDIYVWSDIGCFRNLDYNYKTLILHPEAVPQHQILQMATRKIIPPNNPLFNNKTHQPAHFYHSGSQFAGYNHTILTFYQYFLDTIDKFLDSSMSIADDQTVLQSTCLLHPSICAYVQRKHVHDNAYFGLRHILHHGGNISKYWTMKSLSTRV